MTKRGWNYIRERHNLYTRDRSSKECENFLTFSFWMSLRLVWLCWFFPFLYRSTCRLPWQPLSSFHRYRFPSSFSLRFNICLSIILALWHFQWMHVMCSLWSVSEVHHFEIYTFPTLLIDDKHTERHSTAWDGGLISTEETIGKQLPELKPKGLDRTLAWPQIDTFLFRVRASTSAMQPRKKTKCFQPGRDGLGWSIMAYTHKGCRSLNCLAKIMMVSFDSRDRFVPTGCLTPDSMGYPFCAITENKNLCTTHTTRFVFKDCCTGYKFWTDVHRLWYLVDHRAQKSMLNQFSVPLEYF